MSGPGPVSCARDCGLEWPRDPGLEVACPTCHAAAGRHCRRPSGHRVWGNAPHGARDLLARKEGWYGSCPKGLCGHVQLDLHLRPDPAE